jgi:hypothetical protein
MEALLMDWTRFYEPRAFSGHRVLPAPGADAAFRAPGADRLHQKAEQVMFAATQEPPDLDWFEAVASTKPPRQWRRS